MKTQHGLTDRQQALADVIGDSLIGIGSASTAFSYATNNNPTVGIIILVCGIIGKAVKENLGDK